MKKVILIVLMFLVFNMMYAEGGMEIKKSDWLHMTIPGSAYVIGEQTLLTLGVDEDIAEYGTLAVGCLVVIGHEYFNGVGTKEDIELGFMSLAMGWVFNKAINAIFRDNHKK